MKISSPVKWRLFALAAAVLIVSALLAYLFRYSVVPLAHPVMAIKLDRWTGKTYFGRGDEWTMMSDPSNAEQTPIVNTAPTNAKQAEIACNWDGTPCDEKRR